MNATSRPLAIWLLTALASANVQAAPETDAGPRPVIVVVVHDYAAIPRAILEDAIGLVMSVYDGFGIDIRWTSPVRRPDPDVAENRNTQLIATVHLRIFKRDESNEALPGVLGIDAPTGTRDLITVAHVLYEAVRDESTSAHALAYVLAHLMAGITVAPNGDRAATIVRAGSVEARRLARGDSPLTTEEAERIKARVVWLSAQGRQPAP